MAAYNTSAILNTGHIPVLQVPHTGFHFLYRQKFSVFRAEGTKRPLFGNERQKCSTEISKSALKFFAIRPIQGRHKRKPPCKHITSYSPAFQVISLIRPPGQPAKIADRRIWRMMAIVRRSCLLSLLFSST